MAVTNRPAPKMLKNRRPGLSKKNKGEILADRFRKIRERFEQLDADKRLSPKQYHARRAKLKIALDAALAEKRRLGL